MQEFYIVENVMFNIATVLTSIILIVKRYMFHEPVYLTRYTELHLDSRKYLK
jgi:hypothetical protein